MAHRKARSEEATLFARMQRQSVNELTWTAWQLLRHRKCFGVKIRREVAIRRPPQRTLPSGR